MALLDRSELIRHGMSLYAPEEQGRLNGIAANRRLFNGDYSILNVGSVDTTQQAIIINWFRKIPEFYARFVLSERPTVTTGNELLDDYLADLTPLIWPEVEHANVRSMAYGEGILATHPTNPELLMSFEPDAHFTIEDPLGNVIEDVCIIYRLESNQKGFADVYIYPASDTPQLLTRLTYRYEATLFQELVATTEMPGLRRGRQVIELQENIDRRSPLEDIKPSLAELVRVITGLARSIKRNTNPHLSAPVSVVDTLADEQTDLSQPQLFGINEGDLHPQYVSWDSKLEAIQFATRKHEDSIWAMTGLSRALFDLDVQIGVTSGIALRRLLLPFVSELNHRVNLNNTAIDKYLAIMNNNRSANQLPNLDYQQANVNVDYHFDDIFKDEPTQSNNQLPVFNES